MQACTKQQKAWSVLFQIFQSIFSLCYYEAYSESKYRFAVKKSSNVLYKILLLSDSTFFKLFFQIFPTNIDALIVAGHNFWIASS